MNFTRTNSKYSKQFLQQGVAAVEFALIAVLMITLLLGLLVFWRHFQTQQSLTRAAGDGARMALTLISSGIHYPCEIPQGGTNKVTVQNKVEKIIKDSLQKSNLTPAHFKLLNPQWKCPDTTAGNFSFDVTYELPALLGADQDWLTELTTLKVENRIVVHFQPMF